MTKLIKDKKTGKMSDIHATVSQHLDKHIASYKKKHMDADTLGQKTVAVHAKVAKEHGIEQKHAAKLVNDYVDGALKEGEVLSFLDYLNESTPSSTISRSTAEKPYHVIKYSKDTLGRYSHHHSAHDSKEEASDELRKLKDKPKGSFSGHKVVRNTRLAHEVRIKED